MRTQKHVFALFLCYFLSFFAIAQTEPAYWIRLVDELEFYEVQSASQNILVLGFRSEKLENDYAIAPSQNPEDYLINGMQPLQVGRYSNTIFRYKSMYQNPNTGGWFEVDERYNPEMVMHRIYLVLEDDFIEGKEYTISFPTGQTTFQFSKKTMICESLKVNQVGYNPGATMRNAFLSIWLGDLGGISYSGSKEYEIYKESDHTLVYAGTFSEEFSDDTDGGYPYVIDLSPLTEEGDYYLSIPGVGRSYGFGLGNKYAYHLYYTHMKGLYQQRCGMALEEPHTQWTRGTCHNDMYLMDAEPTEDKITVPDGISSVPRMGGHHDAADFDIRSMHLMVPAWLLSAYEYASERLKDQELNIAESGNAIPDILDEALWNIKGWEDLQTEEGGIRGGIETHGHPQYGEINAERDDYKYGTYRVEGYTTLTGGAVMAYASRLIEDFNSVRAAELRARAIKAWEYYENHKDDVSFAQPDWEAGNEWSPGNLMFAGLQLYLLTGEEKYHAVFKENYRAVMMDRTFEWPIDYQQYYFNGSSLKQGAVFTYCFISYILDTSLEKDEDIINHIKKTVITKADRFVDGILNKTSKYGYLYTDSWGMGSGVGRWAEVMMWAYSLTDDQKYLDASSLSADFVLGANPKGICMTTGLGERPPYDPLIDSFDHIMKGLGPFPGVVLYYYGGANRNEISTLYPEYSEIPINRNFIDNWIQIGKSEFTIWETMAPNIFMYVALMEQNDHYGAVLPYGNPDVFPGGHYNDIENTVIVNTWQPQAPVMPVENPEIIAEEDPEPGEDEETLKVHPNPTSHFVYFPYDPASAEDTQLNIYDSLGKNVENITTIAGSQDLKWDASTVGPGIYFYRLVSDKTIKSGKIIVRKM